MTPTPAQYLLRFDDLCPTVSRSRWQRLAAMIEEFDIKPILAVIPDNQDRSLLHSSPDPGFWDSMRKMEAAGATIALHGYKHLCNSRGRSLLPLHHRSEFAGVPEETQRQWIHAGLEILRGHGLTPKLWVAPRHGFDRATLRVLREEKIKVVSDGFALRPYAKSGMTWIPQQLWEPVEKSKGLWTICIHSNTARSEQINQLYAFAHRNARQFTSVDRVLAECSPSRLNFGERFWADVSVWRILLRNALKRRLRGRRRHRAE